MATCGVCEVGFNEDPFPDPRMNCKYCDRIFHANCAKMTLPVYQFFCDNANYMWYCDTCMESGNYNIDICKRIKHLEQIIVENTKRLDEQAQLIEKLYSSNQSKRQEETPRKQLISNIVKNWSDETPVTSFASVRKSTKRRRTDTKINQARKGDPILVVKPSNDEQLDEIKSVIKQSLNPVKDPVKSLNVNKKGSIIIKSTDHESIEQIQAKLGDVTQLYDCAIDKPKQSKPVIKLVGISEYENNNDELLTNIRAQNDLQESDMEVLFVREIKLSTRKYYTAYIRTDTDTFSKIMKTGRLNISWDRVKCYEHVNVLRCFKCSLYGHIAEKCTSDKYVCAKCNGDHDTKTCNSETNECPNCVYNNEKLKMNLPTDHPSWDSNCPSLNTQISRMKRRLRYEQ